MSQTISKSQFKARALELFRQVESSGVPIIITDRGEPRLELRPLRDNARPSPLDQFKGLLFHYERPTDPVGEEDWEALQ